MMANRLRDPQAVFFSALAQKKAAA